MTLPIATAIGNIDRFNRHICTVSFAEDLTPDQQSGLVTATKTYNKTSPGGALKPRYHLEFDGPRMTVCQSAMTEAPTRLQVTGFLDQLGIIHPDDSQSEAAPTTTLPRVQRVRDRTATPRTAARQ